MEHNARILTVGDTVEMADEMRRVGAEPGSVAEALQKAQQCLVKLEGVSAPLAHIITESCLSAGGDAVIGCHLGASKATHTDVIVIGSLETCSSVVEALKAQGQAGVELAAEISAAITNYTSPIAPLAEDVHAKPRVRVLFEEMSHRTLVMGILNVTPDSFSDGGRYLDHSAAIARALRMIDGGADIIDIGGESTRPGSEPVSEGEEATRVLPVVEGLRKKSDTPISVDTYKAEVARAALEAGADIVNDISAMSFDPMMRAVVAEADAAAILMHIKGTPKDMQRDPIYDDVISEVIGTLRRRMNEAVEAGVDRRLLIIDPGFGFGKTAEHNLLILRRLREFKSLGRPVLIGTSRKSTIGKVLGGLPADERLEGTAATVAISIVNGANIVRVHDVKEMARVVRMTDATINAGLESREPSSSG